MPSPFFSICIPVYKNVAFLKRLLDSVFSQSFTDFELIITDDSPDESVSNWLALNYQSPKINYYKNPTALGTPENWNEAIRKANGKWIKLMHDDDWFDSNDALETYYQKIRQTNAAFVFSSFYNYYLDSNRPKKLMQLPLKRWSKIRKYPGNLYAHNIIGPPSVTVIRTELAKQELYDNSLKWLVDLDAYIRFLNHTTAIYISEPLVCIGVGSMQVTALTQLRPEVEIPEGLILLSKLGSKAFDHILYYDAWWRLIRNLGIRDVENFKAFVGDKVVPETITKMIYWQRFIPPVILKLGPVSKSFMFLSWLVH